MRIFQDIFGEVLRIVTFQRALPRLREQRTWEDHMMQDA